MYIYIYNYLHIYIYIYVLSGSTINHRKPPGSHNQPSARPRTCHAHLAVAPTLTSHPGHRGFAVHLFLGILPFFMGETYGKPMGNLWETYGKPVFIHIYIYIYTYMYTYIYIYMYIYIWDKHRKIMGNDGKIR